MNQKKDHWTANGCDTGVMVWECETHAKCQLHRSVFHSRVSTPARWFFTGKPWQINMIDTASVNSSPVADVVVDSGDFPSVWSLYSFSWLASRWLVLLHVLLVSSDFPTWGFGLHSHVNQTFTSLLLGAICSFISPWSRVVVMITFLVWSPS